MTTKQYQVTIFATDFKPMIGGVAEYTFHLANELHKLGRLDRVVTTVPQVDVYSFKVDAPKVWLVGEKLNKSNILIKKLNSLFYLCQLYGLIIINIIRRKISKEDTLFIINWIDSSLSKKLISIFHLFDIKYGIVLYGKDIIIGLKKDPHYFDRACKKSFILIIITNATLNLFQEIYPNGKTQKYYILKPGIDSTYLSQISNNSLASLEKQMQVELNDKIVISTVARLVKRKGVDSAIESLEPLLKENKKLLYAIAGDGEEYINLQNLIQERNLGSQVKLLGNITEQEKFALLQRSDIFVMPNHRQQGDDFEGFGISFIEASFFKNVAIGGRSGGAVEAIQDGKTGFLVDTDTDDAIEQLRDILSDLLATPDRIKSIAEDGHQYTIDNFQVSQLVGDFATYLSSTLS